MGRRVAVPKQRSAVLWMTRHALAVVRLRLIDRGQACVASLDSRTCSSTVRSSARMIVPTNGETTVQ